MMHNPEPRTTQPPSTAPSALTGRRRRAMGTALMLALALAVALPSQADAGAVSRETVQTVQPMHQTFLQHVAAEEWDEARRVRARVGELLPPGHLLYKRMDAWLALEQGRGAHAARQYRAILDRLPGDTEAAINLAWLHIQEFRQTEAREVIDAALEHSPRSAPLRLARKRLGH